MNEDVLRAVIRETIARHLGTPPPGVGPVPARAGDPPTAARAFALHVSHARFALPPGDGPCVIEPHVGCEHCGFCQSMGH